MFASVTGFAVVTKKGFRIPASGVGQKTEDGKEGIPVSGIGLQEGFREKVGRGRVRERVIIGRRLQATGFKKYEQGGGH